MSESEVPEKFALDVGQAHEFVITARKAGWKNIDIDRLTKDVDLCRQVLAHLRFLEPLPFPETARVPDKAASALLAEVKKAIGLTYLGEDFAQYGFISDERGKTYNAMVWEPGIGMRFGEVRKHFACSGFSGNTAAFLAWIKNGLDRGRFASIPDDDRCYHDDGDGLCAPEFVCGGCDKPERSLFVRRVDWVWEPQTIFVAFREVKK